MLSDTIGVARILSDFSSAKKVDDLFSRSKHRLKLIN